eukprot:9882659-Ditylum_brightwellii.AAC.1
MAPWCNISGIPIPIFSRDTIRDVVKQVIEDQDILRWDNWIAKSWRIVQQQYAEALPKNNNNK